MTTDYEHEGWITVQRASSRRRLADAELVLTAVEVSHHVEFDGHDWCLKVPGEEAPWALGQIETFKLENVPVVRPHQDWSNVDNGWLGVFGYLIVIWLIAAFEAQLAFGLNWREDGAMRAGLVLDGQWWRTITALTLHADFGHIVANSGFGMLFGLFVGRYLGSGFGWLLVVLAAAFGNGINALIRPDAFQSIGASTATFAALGVTAAFVWRRGYYRGVDWRRSAAPIFAAFAMFAFTGVGGGNTDIGAHALGLACGLGLGAWVAPFNLRWLGVSGQVLSGAAALGLVLVAWLLAASVGG